MKRLVKALYEHLITKKKYNTLELQYKVKCKEYDDLIIYVNTLKTTHKKEKKIWEEYLLEQEQEIIKLKKKVRK